MVFEWLTREGWVFVSWWLLIAAAGVAAFPLCYRLLGGLPDRGYTLSRAVGFVLVAFVFWLAASLGLLTNTVGSMVLAWAFVLMVGLIAYFTMPERVPLRAYWRENRPVILTSEVLFAVLLLGWMLFRSQYPDTWSTEKPMDLMYISSIMHSPAFPPADGWLAGYSISYYHFGYIMAAMLSTLSGVSSTVGFSMTLSSWFALTGLSAFGVTYNLVRSRSRSGDHSEHVLQSRRAPLATGLLAVFFVLVMSNWQFPLIELPWQTGQASAGYYNFWGTQERAGNSPHQVSNTGLDVSGWDNWWWFRASRVLKDVQLDDTPLPNWYAQPIDEFPAFSFLLGDVHPHVLALPFGLMALGLALNLLLMRRNPSLYEMIFYGITIGSLVFLNTWDILAYGGAFIGADALRRLFRRNDGRLLWPDLAGVAGNAALLGVVTLLAYGLFLIGFRSQAGGITLNLMFPTYFPHLILMFGPFLVLLTAYLLLEVGRGRGRINWRLGWGFAGALSLVILAVVLVGGVVLALRPDIQNLSRQFIDQAGGLQALLPQLLQRRLAYLPTALLMLGFMLVVMARLFARPGRTAEETTTRIPYSRASAFTLLLVAIGALLVFIPEFVYLVDNFSARINTIFKFYYQVWAVWGIASAFVVYSVLTEVEVLRPNRVLRLGFGVLLAVILVAGSLYLGWGVVARSSVESGSNGRIVARYGLIGADVVVNDGQFVRAGELLRNPPEGQPVYAAQGGQVRIAPDSVNGQRFLSVRAFYSIDGGPLMVAADDYVVLQCLKDIAQPGEIAVEAERDAYNPNYGRVPGLAGVPVVLGWKNHEGQWRGATYGAVVGTRPDDILKLYTDDRWEVVRNIIATYGIDYIMFGQTEQQQYTDSAHNIFAPYLPVVCESGNSVVYRVPARLQVPVNPGE